MPNPIKVGKKERMTFAKINEDFDKMPNLIEIQTSSYDWFLKQGLKEAFDDISPIRDYANKLSLEFIDYRLSDEPKYSQEECKERDATYAAPLKVTARLINNETHEVKESEVFMCEFPIMTEKGTFIYNGAERAVVTQLVRSPGAYFDNKQKDKSGNTLFTSQVIPNRGAWIEYEAETGDTVAVRLDRNRKQPLTVFLRALGVPEEERQDVRELNDWWILRKALIEGSNQEIINLFDADPRIVKTLEKDKESKDYASGVQEIYRKLRPTDPASLESARSLFNSIYFDDRRYNLDKVGRFKYNQKLGLLDRIAGEIAAEDVINPETGEVIIEKGKFITTETAELIENCGVFSVKLVSANPEMPNDVTKVIGNNFVDIEFFISEYYPKFKKFDLKETTLPSKVYYPELKEILERAKDLDELYEALEDKKSDLSPKYILPADIVASVSYFLNLYYGIGKVDDIDNLGNRRLRTVGELLQNQFRIGLSRMEKNVKEKMTAQDLEMATPQQLINSRPVISAVKEFFGSSQLSQFMDQNNPLAELTHKRRLSALGPGGLSRDRAGFDVRDIHYTHYGRMCPIETPEGPNIGLIGSITTYGKINEYGFIETPYRVVKHVTKKDKKTGEEVTETFVTDEIQYLPAWKEDEIIFDEQGRKIECVIAQANEPLDEKGHFLNEKVLSRKLHGEIALSQKKDVDYMDVSPKQVVSVAAAMIPFLENDDANRALMGSNMQRQAVPLLVTEAPYIGTGIEYKAARDSGVVVLAKNSGTVEFVDAETIKIRRDEDNLVDTYNLLKFKRSNQGTCINQRPIVSHNEHIEKGEVIADGPSTDLGEIALGKNLLIGFMTWEGYNYEDAIVLNERLVMEDVLTSVHVEKYESEARDTKLGPEQITREVPNHSAEDLKNLDEEGIIRVGAEVDSGDILVGKVTPKGETERTAEERLLYAIFGEKSKEVRDTSLKVPHGETGIVLAVKVFTREEGDELPPGVNKLVRVYIATKRKINVGDKMAGRHGNKGVISRILPEEDMPFLENGQPLQVMLNPLGVPSRMNVGQVLEVHLGLAAKKKGWYISTPVFDGASEKDIMDLLKEVDIPETGKLRLRDGRTGEYFDHPVTVGYMYMMKLHHLVDDKIHARSTGPYSLVTQQPLGGKAQFGGQRFGEMEVWALEAYGAAYTLQEILTVKSDDINGRVRTYEAIVKGENIPTPGIPESFKVLIKEMQALGLDIKVLSGDNEEIRIKDSSEYDTDFRSIERGLADELRELEMGEPEENEIPMGFQEEEIIEDDFDREPSIEELAEIEGINN